MQRGSDVAGSPSSRVGVSYARLEVGLVTLIAVAVRLVDLGYPPFVDELHHLLAAGSLVESGSLTIHDGVEYARGWLFTYLVAGFIAAFGQSLEIARLPAVLAGALLVSVVFAWLRAEAGRIAAWTGALLLCFAPISLYLSQQVRFYSLHALAFWIGTFAVYRLLARRDAPARRLSIGLAALAAFLFAFHLQITTVIGLAGVVLFSLIEAGPRLLGVVRRSPYRWLIVGVAIVAATMVLTAAAMLGVFAFLVDRAFRVDFWGLDRADNLRFYHWLLNDEYSFLWTLFPIAVLLALANRWRAGLMFTVVFGVAFVGHSIAAWKAERFLFYAMPAFFAIWGLAAQETFPWLWQRLEDRGRTTLGRMPAGLRRGLVVLGILGALAFAATGPTAYTTSRLIYLEGKDWSPPRGFTGEWYRGHPDWAAAAPHLASLADSVEVVVGEPDMKLVYYLGDLDYIVYAGNLAGMSRDGQSVEMAPEFTAWRKVGRPLISRSESVEAVMTCYRTGLLVAERHVWGWRWGVPRPTADFIEQHMQPVELPESSGVLAFRWESPETEVSARCDRLRQLRSKAPVS